MLKVDVKPWAIDHLHEAVAIAAEHGMLDQTIFRVFPNESDHVEEALQVSGVGAGWLFMFRVTTSQEVDDVVRRFDPMTIEIVIRNRGEMTPERLQAVDHAVAMGLRVETHGWDDPEDVDALLARGVRMLHTNQPDWLTEYLRTRGRH